MKYKDISKLRMAITGSAFSFPEEVIPHQIAIRIDFPDESLVDVEIVSRFSVDLEEKTSDS